MIFEKYSDATSSWDRYYCCQNANFNVMALTDSSGNVVERVQYDPYGKATVTVEQGQTATGNPYLFQGRRWDAEAGLYNFRNRFYSPELGRFVQRDPAGYVDGMNLYEFVGGCPVVAVDANGLKRLIGSEVETFSNYVLNNIKTSPPVDENLLELARWYCGTQLSNERGLGAIKDLAIATAKAPIQAWSLLTGDIVKKLAKKAGKAYMKHIKEELLAKDFQTLVFQTGKADSCNCFVAVAYDAQTETFRGFIHGKVGKIKMEAYPKLNCCTTKPFTFSFTGTAHFEKDTTFAIPWLNIPIVTFRGGLTGVDLKF